MAILEDQQGVSTTLTDGSGTATPQSDGYGGVQDSEVLLTEDGDRLLGEGGFVLLTEDSEVVNPNIDAQGV